jgi:hypothetical protein
MTMTYRALGFPLAVTLTVVTACGGKVENPGAPLPDAATAPITDATIPPTHPPADASEPPPASSLVAVPLSSCVPSVYTATVSIGGSQSFQLSVDTGSTTLGVASTGCACGVSPLYTPGPDAVDENMTAHAEYGTGSWSGEIYQDTVGVGAETSVDVNLVAIDSMTQFFTPVMCDSTSGGMQGIIGLAPAASALAGTNGFFDQLVAGTGTPNVFATELCDSAGTLWLGGYDPTFTTAAPVDTPLSSSEFSQFVYAVDLESVTVAGSGAGTSVPIASGGFTDTIVDTGTSVFLLSTPAFSAITTAIAQSPQFSSVFGMGASWFSNPNNCVSLSQTKAALDAALPPLTLTFGTSPPVTVQALPSESYLIQYEGLWCPALDEMDPGPDFPFASILGSPVLRSNIVIFDRANQRIGFAPHKTCS